MADVKLTIDNFVFTGFEVPEHITFGGAQSLSVHKLPGGSRVVNSMGRDDAPLEWSGVFTGANALSRARFLDSYRIGGAAHTLTWGDFRYSVVIREFLPSYERAFHIPYRIVCEVIEELTTFVNANLPGNDLDSAVKDQIEVAAPQQAALLKTSLVAEIAAQIAKVQAAVANVQAVFSEAMQGIASVVNLEMSVIATVQGAINTAIADINGAEALINNAIGGVAALFGGSFSDGSGQNTGVLAANIISTWAIDSVNAATLSNIKASLTVANRNLGYINGYPNAQEVTVIGGNLADLALQYYGDATQWTVIADANGITDPVINGQVTLTIPPNPATPTNIPGGADIDHWIGGDIVLSNQNDLGTVLGDDKAQQRILRRLLTNLGGYKWHPGYGAGILSHIGDSDYNLPFIESAIIAQVMLEQGVAQSPAPSVTFDVSGDDVTANIQYMSQETDSRQFLSFTVTP